MILLMLKVNGIFFTTPDGEDLMLHWTALAINPVAVMVVLDRNHLLR